MLLLRVPREEQMMWKFGFPVFYVTDLLQNVEALVAFGYGRDSRLAAALDLIRGKQDAAGRWALEYDYTARRGLILERRSSPTRGSRSGRCAC
jgi:hypothetical protein